MSRGPNGLQSALRLCESDKVKDRSEGINTIRTFFSNKENLAVFQETAKRDGGGGWIAFFQCLFQVVVLEKKALLRKSANAQTERRLADAISLVRFMAERSVHLISRKALSALVAHMSSLLVYSSAIFPPAALDYAKALRTLLSYPPHLEHLETRAWRVLIGICWSAILGDEVTIEDGFEEEADEDMVDPSPTSGTPGTQAVKSFSKGRTNTQATTELALLIPILLSSPASPLLPPLPTSTSPYIYEQSVGLSLLLKTQRFFAEYQSETSSHLPILRAMNLILSRLELNCRSDFITGAFKLLPFLVSAWTFRNKAMREQVLIALRMMLPFISHKGSREKDKAGVVKSALDRLMGMLGKESTVRGGILPLDIATIRLESERIEGSYRATPFETRCITAGHDFDHECALRWAALEMYSETCVYLESADIQPPPTPSKNDGTQAKRRKQAATPIKALISAVSMGSFLGRTHALQVMIFIVDRHWQDLDLSIQNEIREKLLALLEDDNVELQSWAFVGISTLASLPSTPEGSGSDTSSTLKDPSRQEGSEFERAWQFARRKSSLPAVSRAACHAAHSILINGKIDTLTAVRDLGSLLQSVDIQGPPYPHDSVCALLDQAIRIARQDVRLYAMKLEERVISWFIKWNVSDGARGKGRLDQNAPADFCNLLTTACHLDSPRIPRPRTYEFLPDCAIVDRVLEEHQTEPIRQFTLYGRVVEPPPILVKKQEVAEVVEDSGLFLEGRPKRVSDTIAAFIRAFDADWPTSSSSAEARPAIPPERCRRTIDLIVLALLFQAILQRNGIRPDTTCLGDVAALLDRILPTLRSSSYDTPALHLMWKGFEPLVASPIGDDTLWPVLLKPNALSGVRRDLLKRPEEEKEGQTNDYEQLLSSLWKMSGISMSLKSLFEPALEIFSGTESIQMSSGTPYIANSAQDDDDFGEIRTADSDAMPISQEALECQRTTSSLLSVLARFRLRGSMLSSLNRHPTKDNSLVNAFLSSEGQRMVQLGTVICDSVKGGILRLNIEAVDLILSSLDEMHRSYAYTRDSGLLKLVLSFMTASAPLWLSVDRSESSLVDDVISLAKSLYRKSSAGQVASWRVRVGLIVFIDEYLDYDPDQTVWQAAGESVNADDSLVASDIVSAGLIDADIHVRFRAATSTAGILYLSSIPSDQHFPFYTDLVNVLPREPKHWDSFITDILWKLNCCITSPHLRAATIYHLYEVPPSTADYNHHLQIGLEMVSKSLGLEGIAPLFLAYAPLVISSQIATSQSPMRVPHRLYGFSTRKAFALHTLERAASSVLLYALAERHRTDHDARQYGGAGETFAALCAAAGLEQSEVGIRHLPATAARAYSDPSSNLFADSSKFDFSVISGMLLTVPGVESKDTFVMADIAEDIITHLFALLDLETSDDDIISIFDQRSGKSRLGSNVYNALIPPQQQLIPAPALVPGSSFTDVLKAVDYLTTLYPSMSSAKILFNTLVRLFHLVNDDFLISEQYRHLRGIALAISLYTENLTHPAILGFLLRETIPLLKMSDIAPIALAMLKLGFDRINKAPQVPDDIDRLVISLGDVRGTLDRTAEVDMESDQSAQGIQDHFDQWIMDSAPEWQHVPAMEVALTIAKSTWPESLSAALKEVAPPTFRRLCDDTEKVKTVDVLPMCRAMARVIQSDTSVDDTEVTAFQENAFWNIKGNLHPTSRNTKDISSFVDLLYASSGQVHPPTLDSAVHIAQDDRLKPLKDKPLADAGPHLRAALVDRIVLLTRVNDYKARSTALGVLQGLLPYIADETTGQLVPKATKDLLALLNPIAATKPSSTVEPISALEGEPWMNKSGNIQTWSTSLSTLLCTELAIRDPLYSIVPLLFENISTAARELLPLLVQSFMSIPEKHTQQVHPRYKALSTHFTLVLRHPQASVETLRAIVEVMLHLRQFTPWYRPDDLGYESWLDVNKILLSQAALKCENYATALMFLETFRSDKKTRPRSIDLYDKQIQEIMYETYSNVEDPDGFYGIQNTDTWDALTRRLQHEGEHWRSFGLHSAALGTGPSPAQESVRVMRDLHHLGFDHVSNSVFASLQQTSTSNKAVEHINESLLFELAWRTSDWDLPVVAETKPSPESLLYTSLRAVHRERDLSVAQAAVHDAINLEIGVLRECGVERMTQIKKTVTDLICLNEVQKWLDPATQADLDSRKTDSPRLSRFVKLNPSFTFTDAERIMATRRSLIIATKEREKQTLFGDMATPRLEMLCHLEMQCLLRVGEMARRENNIQASINALVAVQQLERDNGTMTDAVQDEFSQVLWGQGEHMLAIRHVESQIKRVKGIKEASSRSAILLSRLANWTAKAKLRAPQDITQTFEEAVRLASAHKVPRQEQSQLCHEYALFADSQQAAVSKSPELERLTTYRERRVAELRASTPVASSKKSTKSSTKTEMTLHMEREMKEDEAAINALVQERSNYAKTALKMYAKALALSDVHDDSTTRMCSLWLEHDEDDEVNMAFSGPLQQVPSHKFIFLSPQLAARLDRPKELSPFNDALNKLVLRISMEHPYHILYQVITLAEGMSSLGKSSRNSDSGAEGRGPAAAAILASIASSKESSHGMVKAASSDMQRLALAATSWCLSRSKEEESVSIGKRINVPSDCPLRPLNNLPVPIATAPPAIDPFGRYENIVTLVRYRSTYAVLGGIHRPKRMTALGSDGKEYAELYKGEDELRQDAVMEQVFEMSNKLLKRDRKTKSRDLRFRTYGVIPLARKTGIMEFVGNSQAIGDWLKPAHTKYGKINDDISADEFRKNLKPIQDKEKDWAKLPGKFTELRSNFHPVMRHFFTEKHRDPMAWFTMRLNYTRSVAVTSMVGWMLGIGDRHCSNILIDQKSGELVHIDFGIVFEDGRRLRIPEKVPFRLTNDLVDGFGVTGVEGTFRRCSEHTLRVLRESSELIMTVLEVFKHDPLYAWDADPEKLQRAQGGGRVSAAGTSASALEKADRILGTIRGKLRDDLSVEYTVNQLIQEARDVENLAKIFVGWQPWF